MCGAPFGQSLLSTGQHFDTIHDLFIGVETFLGERSADVLQTVFQERYDLYSYAARAAENTLNEDEKKGYCFCDDSNR
jgi:hypothetical protein